ncbi:MAG: fibronectin type III domain-containing protein [Nitrospirae bacterium]|nr:fibronectin type III domain-containing protein [Nitrospirota bacterium]
MAGPEGEDLPVTPTEATARLTWAVNPDPTVTGYRVYYGKESSGEPGSCSYEASQSVEAPPAIITGLEPNTPYFFAISAFGGEDSEAESPCSNEVLMISSPAQG